MIMSVLHPRHQLFEHLAGIIQVSRIGGTDIVMDFRAEKSDKNSNFHKCPIYNS